MTRRLYKTPRRAGAYWASQASRSLFQSISDNMSDGMLVSDRQGVIILVNAALGHMLGWTPQDMMGKSWAELFFDGRTENDPFNDVVLEVIQRQVCHHNRQVSFHPHNGEPRELIITADLLRQNGREGREIAGMLVVFKDITEIKILHKREQELLHKSRRLYQEKLEGLDRLARAVAHEIRNPVMSIGGLSKRLLVLCQPQDQQTNYLERIIASSSRLEEIVAQVRAYADLPAPKPLPLTLLPWLGDAAQEFRERAQAQGVTVAMPPESPELAGLTVEADGKLLRRLLATLFDNALEAMPQGGTLTLELTRQAEPPWAMLSVSDSGRGIAPDDLPYIFDPFFSTKAYGVGMSLAMAKRIAEEHGGELFAESAPGQGATFILRLPLA